jgi:hypothetical protein
MEVKFRTILERIRKNKDPNSDKNISNQGRKYRQQNISTSHHLNKPKIYIQFKRLKYKLNPQKFNTSAQFVL